MAKTRPEETIKAVREDELDRAVAEKTVEMKNTPAVRSEFEEVRRKNGEGHRERLKQRFLKSGAAGLADHEMLELLLFYALPRRDTKPIAYDLIKRFGSLAAVFNASPEQLMEVNFITENSAVLFKLIPELMNVYYSASSKSVPCMSTSMLAEIFKPHFVGINKERLVLACFDSELKFIKDEVICEGTADRTALDVRKIMSVILKNECTMAALAHNHPGGSPNPSDADIAVTRRIIGVFRETNIHLMDHIIVGANDTYSMRENGDLGIFD